ncbi:MAG: hypothetical protein ABI873_19115 [Marmoricola sp.]
MVTSLPGFHRLMRPILRDAESGADTIVWLPRPTRLPAAGNSETTAPGPEHYLRRTRESREDLEKLWAHVLDATGLA